MSFVAAQQRSVTSTSDKPLKTKAGALWQRSAKSSGETFFSGQLEVTPELERRILEASADRNGRRSVDIVVFSNTKKDAEKYPDFHIFFSDKRD